MESAIIKYSDTKASFIEEAQVIDEVTQSTTKPFIQANTVESSLFKIKEKHIIPVFIKDNEPVISHSDFVETMQDVVSSVFHYETVYAPSIRLSHPIKGRIPEARNKPAQQLLEHEKTLYYERMAFVIEIPSIHDDVDGNMLSLTVGGVKAYNLDNLYNRKGADEHFKVFIGFQNKICTNLCVWSDGYAGDIKVKNLHQLRTAIYSILASYNAAMHLENLKQFSRYSITEQQFAQLIGRCRMYNYLPTALKGNIPQMSFGDQQLGIVCKDYYKDSSFCRMAEGTINLWRLYNLFTGANKSTYIDQFLDRSVNAFQFTEDIRSALDSKSSNWYLN